MRTAFVSGGSSGIGLALAEALLRAGYGVTICARRPEKLAAAARGLEQLGPLEHVAADFAQEQDIEAAIARHGERFGSLDVLVNNAGVGIGEPVAALRTKAVDLLLAVNLRSAILCTRAALPWLREAERAHVFNVASYTGVHPQAGLSVYSASKAGLIAFSDALRAEVGPGGIKVSAICPAFVDTAMGAVAADAVGRDRLIAPADVVAVVLALLSLSPACVVPTVVLESAHGPGLHGWEGGPA